MIELGGSILCLPTPPERSLVLVFELLREDTGVLVIDYQERLCGAMPEEVVARNGKNVQRLLVLAQRLGLPMVVSEQYPQGLGPTVQPIAEHLTSEPIPKTAFSVVREPAVAAALEASGRKTWLVTGMETHICVFQSVRDLVSLGYGVQVVADAVVSRTQANWNIGLDLMRSLGVTVTSTETALFDLVGVGSGKVFKEVSRMIR